jgi:hypothetical protein
MTQLSASTGYGVIQIMNKLTETAPPEIHLCIGDDAYMLDEEMPTWGVTWADHPAQAVTVRYTRADLASKMSDEKPK